MVEALLLTRLFPVQGCLPIIHSTAATTQAILTFSQLDGPFRSLQLQPLLRGNAIQSIEINDRRRDKDIVVHNGWCFRQESADPSLFLVLLSAWKKLEEESLLQDINPIPLNPLWLRNKSNIALSPDGFAVPRFKSEKARIAENCGNAETAGKTAELGRNDKLEACLR